jgi:hypothetical protein
LFSDLSGPPLQEGHPLTGRKARRLFPGTLRAAASRYADVDLRGLAHDDVAWLRPHALGVGSGYTQQDVQELARILTGAGVNPTGDTPKLKKEWEPPDDGAAAQRTGFPQNATRLYYDSIEPQPAADTRAALDKASSQAEWNTFLLASPDLNYH